MKKIGLSETLQSDENGQGIYIHMVKVVEDNKPEVVLYNESLADDISIDFISFCLGNVILLYSRSIDRA